MAASSRADCAPWAFGTSLPHQPRLGRMPLPNGRSDRTGVNVWTTSLSWARCIFAESCDSMLAITTKLEHIGHWIRMRQSLARFSASVSSFHATSWADFITTRLGFRYTQPLYHHLWDGYSKLMRAYGKKLGQFLNKGWKGPPGTYGRWTLQGDWLGF